MPATSRALPYRGFDPARFRPLPPPGQRYLLAQDSGVRSGARFLDRAPARRGRAGRLQTRKGPITLPAFLPSVTFGGRRELDELLRPFLPELAGAVLVSEYAAAFMADPLPVPTMIDAGGFLSHAPGVRAVRQPAGRHGAGGGWGLRTPAGRLVTPAAAWARAVTHGELLCTLDHAIPPGAPARTAETQWRRSRANAVWTLARRDEADVLIFAGLPAGDDPARTARRAQELAALAPEGLALGGLVARLARGALVEETVCAVLAAAPDLPLHAFGLGEPALLDRLFRRGLASADSSAPLRRLIAAVQARRPEAAPTTYLAAALARWHPEGVLSAEC